ncbi:MAG: hypothetical protein CM1200mP20_00620 [Pseudomonadota bacterium]|nr:MAG: hypothetical protein CM1200mP20_00620 [Pseudomonadota bacterium]
MTPAGARSLGRQRVPDPDFYQDLDPIVAQAAASVSRSIRTSRQSMSPLEGRGVLASWDSRLEQLVVYTSTQQPHIVRTGLSECLGIEHAQIRVCAGCGWGLWLQGYSSPEEICLGWAAKQLGTRSNGWKIGERILRHPQIAVSTTIRSRSTVTHKAVSSPSMPRQRSTPVPILLILSLHVWRRRRW